MIWLLLAFTADAKKTKPEPPPPEPPELRYPAAQAQMTPGSLWSEVPARRMMGLDGNARQVGDLVTVLIFDTMQTSMGATTDTSRASSNTAAISALLGAEKTLLKSLPNAGSELGIDLSSGSQFSGSGNTTRDATVRTVLTCKVIEVLPNGNLRIWGHKKVRVNRETTYVVLEGEARPRDIQMDNTVRSDLLADADLYMDGKGVVSDKQGPGIGTRILDMVWPF